MAFLFRNTGALYFPHGLKSMNNLYIKPTTLAMTSLLGGATFATEATTTRRRRKSTEDLPPKRPGSAYTLFTMDQFPKVKQQNPSLAFSEVAKQLSSQWKILSDSDKRKYISAFSLHVQKYHKELAAYEKLHPRSPAKPQTPFFLYLAQQRKENPTVRMVDISKNGAQKWHNLTDNDKKKYVQEYDKQKLKWEADKEEWDRKYGHVIAEKPKRTRRSKN